MGGTDTIPMWHGDTLYYLCDAGPEHRLNIWSCDAQGGNRRQITKFADFDIKWPSIGPDDGFVGEIVFQNGANLMVLNLATRETRTVTVKIPGARANCVHRQLTRAHLSMDGIFLHLENARLLQRVATFGLYPRKTESRAI